MILFPDDHLDMTDNLIRDLDTSPLFGIGERRPRRTLTAVLRHLVADDASRQVLESFFGVPHLVPEHDAHLPKGRFDLALGGGVPLFVLVAGHEPTLDELDSKADSLPQWLQDEWRLMVVCPLAADLATGVVTPAGRRWHVADFAALEAAFVNVADVCPDPYLRGLTMDAAFMTHTLQRLYEALRLQHPEEPIGLPAFVRRNLRHAGLHSDVVQDRMTRAARFSGALDADDTRIAVQVCGSGASTTVRQLVELDNGDRVGWEFTGTHRRQLVVTDHLNGQTTAVTRRREEYIRDRYADHLLLTFDTSCPWGHPGLMYGDEDSVEQPPKIHHSGGDTVYTQWRAPDVTSTDLAHWAVEFPKVAALMTRGQ